MRGIVPNKTTGDELMDGQDTKGPASNPTYDYRNEKVCSLIERVKAANDRQSGWKGP